MLVQFYLIIIQSITKSNHYKFKLFLKMEVQKPAVQTTPTAEQQLVKEQPQQIHTLLLQIRDILVLLDKAISNKQTRTISKLTKHARKFRNVIKAHHVLAISQVVTQVQLHKDFLRRSKDFQESFTEKFDINKAVLGRISKNLQLQIFLRIFIVQILWREQRYNECLQLVNQLIDVISQANKRSLDNYGSVLYGYFSRIHQKKGDQLSIRETLLDAYNKACVRVDEISQSTLLNLLLRNYLKHNHIDAAYNLIQKTTFPESKSNNQFCKYLLYTGRVKAVRRQYSDALSRLNQAIRKSPDNAKGFKIQCQKVAIVVELLQGQIPNRQIFADHLYFSNAYPYYKLIQVVLQGQLKSFHALVQKFKDAFQRDKLYNLTLRLNQIVIRIGLRRISMAYSKISLQDIAKKLNIPREDVQFVVAKALRDGIMHGQIDHDSQILRIEGDKNVYVTNEPQAALNKRIKYCLGLYHQTQKAITYPDMKMKVQEAKQTELDASQLLELLDFDDDM